jgi:hypothetical protein
MRMHVLGTLAASAICISATPSDAQTWTTIPCSQSALRYAPEVSCAVDSATRDGSSSVQAVSKVYQTEGQADGTSIFFILVWPNSDTYIKAYTSDHALAGLKEISRRTNHRASNWGDLQNIGQDISYVTFRSDTQACVGIDRAGPMKIYGFAWQLAGFACRPEISGPTDAFVRSILANVKIGD